MVREAPRCQRSAAPPFQGHWNINLCLPLGVLGSPDDFLSAEDVFEAVGGFLVESSDNGDEEGARGFCETLYSLLAGGGQAEECLGGGDKVEGAKLLDVPVQLSTKLKITGMGCILSFKQFVRNKTGYYVKSCKVFLIPWRNYHVVYTLLDDVVNSIWMVSGNEARKVSSCSSCLC